ATRPLALLVDRLLDEREVVVKSLGPVLANQRLCTGAIVMPDGKLVLLLNPAALSDRAREIGRPAPSAPQTLSPARLLVAEDSFTTRELLRSILQSAGYTVETAIHGRDALDKLQANTYDLVVSDVEMPHLTGFELTRQIRADSRLQDLPVIIITSLAREADRREGLLAGAQAYIVKSQFDQSNLLETIQQLLGR
ncbi:MAG TPA: response regulator, partial [Herpetosiphonaceae bacterium]|nr:response regulator [Herpetosiphonaceae bacterium]